MMALVLVAGFLQVPLVAGVPETAAHADVSSSKATEAEALAAARRSDEPVEITSQRGESRTVRALPSGRIEIEQHLQPIRTRQDGKWVAIDTGLRRSGDAVVPTATTVGLRFSGGGSGPMVQLTRDGRKLALTWPGDLPEPVLEGDTAVYRGVAGPDVDLRLRALADGFTHVLVVKSAEAARDPRVARLALAMSTSGLSVREQPDGGVLEARTSSGTAMFEAPTPMMWDSSHEGSSARAVAVEPNDGARSAAVDVAVTDDALTLIPDQELLRASDTVFPVYIDPVWTTKKASSWGMVSSGWPDQSYYKFAGKSDEGMGRCEVAKDSRCVKNQTKRLFYRMPLPAIKGRYIQKVEFIAFETSAYDCHDKTTVQLWRTSTLKSSATWDNSGGAWDEHLDSQEAAYCSKAPVEFGGSKLRSSVQGAVNKGQSTITLGLKAYSESTMAWWKRFSDDAYLKVQYNNPPSRPDTDTMFANPGTKCVSGTATRTVNDVSKVYAYLKDPDIEDKNKVQGQFALFWANKPDNSDWSAKWTSGLTPAKTSGSRFEIQLPNTIPQKSLIGWVARAWDGEQWGPWSYTGGQTGCYFYYDPARPEKPTISSSDYPADDAWHGGVGQTGIFTISDAGGVADRYEITLNDEPARIVRTAAGAPQQVQVAPTRSGPNILTVQAFAPSSQNGAVASYEFRTSAGSEPVARFAMDEEAGSTAATSTGPGRPAWVHGSATLGGEGKKGTALTLDGVSGYAESSLPVVDTTKSFTVSAWAKPTGHRQGEVLAQNGKSQTGFVLGMHADGAAIFEWPTVDNNQDGTPWQWAVDDQPLPLGQWSHLTGVYDKDAGQMRLYVNGELQATANGVTPLETHGPLQIGRSLYNGFFVNNWPGSIDDVQVFTKPLSDAQAQQLATGTTPEGTDLVAHWTMDEEQGAPRVYSTAAPWKATLHNGATLGAPGLVKSALKLNNTAQQYAATDRLVVNTMRSFAISAWVKPDGKATSPSRNFTAVSARGANKSGFYLKYVEATDRWVFARTAQDSDDPGWYQATSKDPARTDEWTHLVGVYDEVSKKLQIYVNGVRGTDSPEVTSSWLATGGLEIGRSQWATAPVDHWAGEVDDVRVYDRILGDREAEELVTEHPVLKARWSLNANGGADPYPAGAPGLVLHNGATIDPTVGFKGASAAGLKLGTAKAFAETAAPLMQTNDSFTVAGWVRNVERPQQLATVFSQPGANTNAFVLRYVPGEDPEEQGVWQVAMQNSDSSSSEPLVASHSYFVPGDWVHIAVVYDALRDRVSLYVNGQLDETSDGVSEQDQVVPFKAEGNGGLQIGRNKLGATDGTEFWPDALDDVWAYQGALTQPQLARLASEPELPTQTDP